MAQVLVLVGMGMLVTFAIFQNQSLQMDFVQNMSSPISAQVVKARVSALLMSDKAMATTVQNFLAQPTSGGQMSFALYSDLNGGELVVDSRLPNSGFTVNGEPCQAFDPVNGNDLCPFRYELQFSEMPTLTPLQFKVAASLKMKAKKLRALNSASYDFVYSNIQGSQEIRNLVETCRAFNNGVLIGAKVEAGLASCSSFIKDCGAGSVGIEFDSAGFPKCTTVKLEKQSCAGVAKWVTRFSTEEHSLGCN